jgi:hypothetical protein
MAISIVDYVEALESRLFDFAVRTNRMDLVVRLRNQYYNRVSELYKLEVTDLELIKRTHRVAGGISQMEDGEIKERIVLKATETEVDLVESLPGVHDYSVKLKSELRLDIPIAELYKNIYRATLDAVQLVRRHCEISPIKNTTQYAALRGIYGAYRHLRGSATLGKAMITGFVIDVLASHKYLKSLSIMTNSSQRSMLYLKTVC